MRIPRIEVVAVAADLLMIVPAIYLAVMILRADGLARRPGLG
ncbi:hypothetical protein [Catenuloplanes atrovinosus]|nr:hypothetical protein [Catenuloplanes atrovinosus]